MLDIAESGELVPSSKPTTPTKQTVAKEGYCVICRHFGPLTRDHVVPRSCGGGNPVDLQNLVGALRDERTRVSQAGMHLRSVCGRCNSGMGTNYDPELASFAAAVKEALDSGTMPKKFLGKPLRIARAVVGHVLASYLPDTIGTSPPGAATMFDGMRAFFLSPDRPAPPELRIYWWLYDAPEKVVITAAGHTTWGRLTRQDTYRWLHGPRELLMGSIVKFRPLGLWVVWDKPADVRIHLEPFPIFRATTLDDVRGIPVPRRNPPSDWPEKAQGEEMFLLNDQATLVGVPRARRGL